MPFDFFPKEGDCMTIGHCMWSSFFASFCCSMPDRTPSVVYMYGHQQAYMAWDQGSGWEL